MNVVDKLISPSMYMKLVEHLRSHLDVPVLSTFDLLEMEVDEVQIRGFKTEYFWEVMYRQKDVEVDVEPSLLIIPGAAKKTKEKQTFFFRLRGVLAETLYPGQEQAQFEFAVTETVEVEAPKA